jgi:hypothetical protein
MKTDDQKARFWRTAFTVCKAGFLLSFFGGLAYSIHLQTARPTEPVAEQGLTVPIKVLSGIYVSPPEATTLHTMMVAAVVFLCATIFCYTKTAVRRV